MESEKHEISGPRDHIMTHDLANQANSVDESRRRFTKSSIAVSGVLLTLASRPSLGGGGFGGGGVCKSPSGFLSGNVSHHGNEQYCSGRTPGYWGTNTNTSHPWPSPYKTGTCSDSQHTLDYQNWSTSGATMFKDLNYGFHCTGYGARYIKYSMMQVILLGGSGDPDQLGAHTVAALLNARMGWTPVLTETQVRNIFNEWDLKGYFEPTAGVRWYGGDIVTYLKSTMTL